MFKTKTVFLATLSNGEQIRYELDGGGPNIDDALVLIGGDHRRITQQMAAGGVIHMKNRQINLGGIAVLDYLGGFIELEKSDEDTAAIFIDNKGFYVGPFVNPTFKEREQEYAKGKRGILIKLPEGIALETAHYVTGVTADGKPECVAFATYDQANSYYSLGGIESDRQILTYDELASSLSSIKQEPLWSKQ